MSTIVAIRKENQIVLAADTLTKFGSQKEPASMIKNHSRIVQVHDNYFGVNNHTLWPPLLRNYFFKYLDRAPTLSNVDEIFEEMDVFHHYLKTEKYLVPQSGGEDEFEYSHTLMLLVNPHGIFGIYGYRQVMEYTDFMAIGSGDRYALGAIQVLMQTEASPERIATGALEAAAFFDDYTAAPFECVTVQAE